MILLLIASNVFPSGSMTSWMEPAAFRLALGDSMESVQKRFEARGWELGEGRGIDQLVHHYDETRTVTLYFRDAELSSIRFELTAFVPDAKKAFEERETRLRELFGDPRSLGEHGEEFSGADGTVHLVLVEAGDDAEGVATLVVRYFVREAV